MTTFILLDFIRLVKFVSEKQAKLQLKLKYVVILWSDLKLRIVKFLQYSNFGFLKEFANRFSQGLTILFLFLINSFIPRHNQHKLQM